MSHFILTPPTDESVITYTQLSGIQEVDKQDHVLLTIQSQFSDINLSFVSQQATASQVIEDVMRQLSFEETPPNHPWLTPTTIFSDVAGSGVESSGLSHDESFGVDDLDLNLNEPVDLNVSQIETQYELPVFEEPNVGRTQEPIVKEVRTQEPIMEKVRTQEPIMKDVIVEDYVSSGEDAEQGNGQEDESAPNDDDDFLADEENEVVEPKVDVHLFGISMDVPFDNIGVTNLVLDDVLEGEDVDVINAYGFDSYHEIYYCTRGLGQFYMHSIKSRRNLKLFKNNNVRVRARCDEKVPIFTMSQGSGPTGPNQGIEVGPSGSSGPTNKSKKGRIQIPIMTVKHVLML
ncbi:hypothetical protein Tco_1081366 [Tanacetum coccineum]|uniref:Transposase MuDR plant domain-containing protein n=1 Tax=Tanacetum coccineum TaxID=301880 RepID=A0ABQ5HX90_9ASTR